MRHGSKLAAAAVVFGVAVAAVTDSVETAAHPPASAPAEQTLSEAYPGLLSGALVHARPAALPAGTVLKAGRHVVTEKDLAAEIAQAPEAVREQLGRNGLFVLEQMATSRLLLDAARAAAGKDGKDPAKASEPELLRPYFEKLTADVTVTDDEVAEYYRKNRQMMGKATLETVREAIKRYLLQQKRQEKVGRHVRTLGKRTAIAVSAKWAGAQAALAMDNPVDKARASGRPSLVDFGAETCRPCKMMAPILVALRKKYADKANVIFVSVGTEQVLAARYGVRSIPVQVFFDKAGKEVFRHVGFYGREEIEKRMAEMGAN